MKEASPFAVSDELIQILRSAQSITVLTGAGISAESGIPTFRDSQTGLWAKYDPHQLASPQAFFKDPQLVLSWYRWRYDLVSQASPNPGHTALAEMERRVPRFTLITQNVDGLHRRAGSQNVIEIHGSLQRLRCSNASCQYHVMGWPAVEMPKCPTCGSLLRPDVVWFGEMMPQDAIASALEASQSCDIFFSIGTSGVVEPAASLPYSALHAGSIVVEVNPQPTPLSVYAKFYYSQPSGIFLPKLVEAVWG